MKQDFKKTSRREFLKAAALGTFSMALSALTAHKAVKIYRYKKRIIKDTAEAGSLEERLKEREEFLKITGGSTVELSLREINCENIPGKNAVLVQYDNRGEDNAYIMGHLLRAYGYQCQTIEPRDASEDHIIKTLEEVAETSKEDSQTVFYYTGHGSDIWGYEEGISVNGGRDVHEKRIIPLELLLPLGKIKGKKAIVIDTCHSGAFVDYLKNLKFEEMALGKNVIDNYAGIASCPANCLSVSSPYFIKGRRIGSLTIGLYNLLNFVQGQVNLSTADIKSGNEAYRENVGLLNEILTKDSEYKISFEMQRDSDTDFIL